MNLKGIKKQDARDKYIMKSFKMCAVHRILIRRFNSRRMSMGRTYSTHRKDEKFILNFR